MALTPEIVNEAEIAKSYVINSELDDDHKKTLLSLLNTTTIATNGISPEEKIQKMTEAIHLLTVAEVTFMTKMDERVENAIKNANNRQCGECKAMRFISKEEEKRKRDQAIAEYKLMNGITDEKNDVNLSGDFAKDLRATILKLVLKPYVWVFGCIIAISPHGVDMVKTILDHFCK